MVKRTITITTVLLILTMVVSLIVVLNKASFAVDDNEEFYVPPSELPEHGSTVVDSGTQSTCTWRLYTDGTMVISPTDGVSGDLGNIGVNRSPTNFHNGSDPSWKRIRTSVKYVIIDEGVSAGRALDGAFASMTSLEYVDLRNLDMSNCTASITYLFSGDSNLKKIDFGSNFTTSQIVGGLDLQVGDHGIYRDFDWMFEYCTSLETLDLSVFDVTQCRTYPMSHLNTCSSLKRIKLGDQWNFNSRYDYFPTPPSTGGYSGKWIREDRTGQTYTPAELAAEYMADPSSMVGTWVWAFSPTAIFTEDKTLYMVRPAKIYDSTNNVGTILSISGDEYTGQIFNIDESSTGSNRTWNSVKDQVEKVVFVDEIHPSSTQSWFEGFSNCTEMDLSQLITSETTDMSQMFSGCTNLTSLDLSGFDTREASNMKDFLLNDNNLEIVQLGRDFSFDGQGNITYKAILPTPTGERYTGKWVHEEGTFGPYTPEELRDNYNGSNMAGNWIRERKPFAVTYSYTGTIPQGASELPETIMYQEGTEVTVAENATAPGYTFNGWSRTGTFTMPAENVEITGSFTANNNTPYKVEHYTKDLNGNTYTLRETENKTGTTDSTATADPKSYEGFTFDNSIDGTLQSGNISGDGNLTLKLYYKRNSYNVSYSYTSAPVSASSLPTNQSYEFEAEVPVAENATAPGYTFSGWSRTGTFTMPAENVEITGSFTANNNTPYKVEHYTKDLNANTFTLKETENKTGTTDVSITATSKTYEGFTFDAEGSTSTGTISGDGNLVLQMYYNRNSYTVSYAYQGDVPTGASSLPTNQSYEYEVEVTVAENATAPGYTFNGWSRNGTFTMPAEDIEITGSFRANANTSYKVEHYTKDLNANTYTLRETENKTGTTDTTITANPKSYSGFTFDNSIEGTLQSGNVSADGNLTLKLYYTRNSYNVSYSYTSAPASASSLPSNQSYEFEAEVTVAEDAEAPGYTFNGWSRTGTFTMPAEDVEITGSFRANTNTSYKIEHYTKDLNANTYTLKETENKTGTTDVSIIAIPKTYEGFTFDEDASTSTGTISGDGNLVLQLYYNRNSYTVSYTYQGDVPTGASTLPADQSYEYGAEVTVAEYAIAPGYIFNGWNRTGVFTMPAEDVIIKGSFSSNSNTTYKVEHYKENINSDTFSLFETDTLAGETGADITAVPNTYSGFTFNAEASTITGTISGDGKLVLKLYYNRNSYTISYTYQGNEPTGASALPANQSYEYGAEVTIAEDATAPGYTFSGWSRTGVFTMPAEDLEITGSFSANTNTSYKVEHYLEIGHSGEYSLKDEYIFTGETDTEIVAELKEYSGYELDETIEGTKKSGTIAGDGSLVLKLYYKNINYLYKIEYYFDGELDSTLEEILNAEIDSVVSSAPVTPVRHGDLSYTLVSNNHKITISSNDEDNIIKIYYETDVLDYEIDDSSIATEGDGIPDKYQIKINYKVEKGSWDDGKKEDKIDIVSLRDKNGELSENGTGKLNVPQVGNKPNEGYAAGSWNMELPSEVSKNNDGDEFIYSYKKAEIVDNGGKEEPSKQEKQKTEITENEAKISNPKTDDAMNRYLLTGVGGILVLMLVSRIRRKYSRKARKIQF